MGADYYPRGGKNEDNFFYIKVDTSNLTWKVRGRGEEVKNRAAAFVRL